ncbi:MAG TPA: YicC/YloC family endoribonuclease [Rhodocyclaceae bacterium]|nr:YicC/YloC family endoribonuclease [Rhodocyclaceae bacterium]
MIQSMTGYAVGDRSVGTAALHMELKSVNARFLDVVFRAGEELRFLEMPLRELLAARIQRGKLECRLHLVPHQPGVPRELTLDDALVGQLGRLQQSVRAALPDAAPLSVAEVLRWPGMLGDENVDPASVQTACVALAAGVIDEFLASRLREGAKLAETILDRVARMRELVASVGPMLPQALADYQQRLATRLREAVAALDEERIRQEIGVFAARIDVAEELARLSTHLDEVQRVVEKGGAVGKRLDFLMQELNREANTLASKSVSAEVTAVALDLKLLIEQMREQVQNLE